MASSLFNLLGGASTPGPSGDPNHIPAEFSAQLEKLKNQLGGRDPMEIYNQLNLDANQKAQVKAFADKIYNIFQRR